MISYFHSLFELFFPRLCVACLENQPVKNHIFCISCIYNLPESSMYLQKENELTDRVKNIMDIKEGAALFIMVDESKIHNVVHLIKYKDRSDIAIKLGEYFGNKIKPTEFFKADVIIPVPLHPKKKHQRGYNQSEAFASGLSQAMGIPLYTKSLIRVKLTETQTKKSRVERAENIKDAFSLHSTQNLQNKSIILVDDVMTTGVTIEGCYRELKKIPGTSVSILTIALAHY